MKRFHYILLLSIILSTTAGCNANKRTDVKTSPPSHSLFNNVLDQHVKGDMVDYDGLKKNQQELLEYLHILSENPPTENWSKNEKLAYWINAYNAFTLKLIIDNYPVESITDLHPTIHIPLLNTVWHKKFFKIGGLEMSLDEIEHKILRKEFNEPRIHFAINCASVSCPPLRNEAYTAEQLDKQLDEQARAFINDKQRNVITENNPRVSKIFSWFKGDFKQSGTLISYLNKYSNIQINENADVDFLDYDWGLNDVK
ncbi:DUF547 domain-containing protein [Fulvivirga lutea]|uniref:DUF547 domain-containing protein n=1 Tax=Fulvivirga lutea TaxID=2810512 RepID=A0A975A083_9BACT|nr:DUF547 domain-containing protein [Fulvivirga lutea]QSE97119.1 DUF547 domain-containing protein [Fulvivirga lutea]